MEINTITDEGKDMDIKSTSGATKLFVREVLLSTGELTREAVISYEGHDYYDSAPLGSTVGLKETQSEILSSAQHVMELNLEKGITGVTQAEFDKVVSEKYDSQTSTAFSLAYLRLLAHKKGFSEKEIYKYISLEYKKDISSPKIICNVLNGGKHAYNNLAFCEFMIIPKGVNTTQNIRIVSEVYVDLKYLISSELGENNLFLGREGGFSPLISDVEVAISLLYRAIGKRNADMCFIAIDVAANNFTKKSDGDQFEYIVNEKSYTTASLIEYYSYLTDKYPSINYLEDPLHENDIAGWKNLFKVMGHKILIVADDLTVSKLLNLEKYPQCFNACILKINQSGNFTELIKAFDYCVKNNIQTIVSQRSGETDSNIVAHMAVGLGGDYMKAGAPARERIIKYNELLRIT